MSRKKGFIQKIITLCLVLCMVVSGTVVSAATSKDVTKSMEDRKSVTKLVNNLSDYIGYQLLYTKTEYKNKKITLDSKFMFEIAGMCMSEPTEKKIHKITKDVFGKTPDLKELTLFKSEEKFNASKKMAGRLKDGTILTKLGDWGTAAPTFKVTKILQNSKTKFQVKVDILFIDYEDGTSKFLGTAKMNVKKNADSKYGYVITSLTVNRAK